METQNPVGTTYGAGVSSVPPYYIGQTTGDNDGWRIYGEAPSSNDVKVIFEVIDDIESGDTWVFRNKQTYSPWNATESFVIEGNGNIRAAGTITASGYNKSNWDTAYSWGNHAGLYAAASHTHSYLPLSGGTLTGTLTGRDIVSSADRTYNLGADDNRWRIVFCETLDSAGLHEANLASKKTGFYKTGTVLVWKNGEAVPCTDFADYMKIGIAVYGNPSPLVQGAEPVLCTGKVNEGDYLVTSQTEGHAIAMNRKEVKEQDVMDCVIGKALESGEGDSHLIKTWVNI